METKPETQAPAISTTEASAAASKPADFSAVQKATADLKAAFDALPANVKKDVASAIRAGTPELKAGAAMSPDMMAACTALMQQIQELMQMEQAEAATEAGEPTAEAAGEAYAGQKGKLPPWLKPGGGKPNDTQKSDEEKALEKAGRKIAADRLAKLKESVVPLMNLIKEVDPMGFLEMWTGNGWGADSQHVPPNNGQELPNGSAQPPLPQPSALQKSVAETVAEAMRPIVEKVDAVTKRIDEVKGVSKTVEGEGTDTPEPAKKSFWSGVI